MNIHISLLRITADTYTKMHINHFWERKKRLKKIFTYAIAILLFERLTFCVVKMMYYSNKMCSSPFKTLFVVTDIMTSLLFSRFYITFSRRVVK